MQSQFHIIRCVVVWLPLELLDIIMNLAGTVLPHTMLDEALCNPGMFNTVFLRISISECQYNISDFEIVIIFVKISLLT